MDEFAAARTVMAFWSLPHEIDTAPVLQRAFAAGKTVLLPKIVSWADRVIAPFKLPSEDAQMVAGRFGLLEPPGDDPFSVADIDLIVCPGLAFDRQGNRLGHGAGLYDRFLSQADRHAFTVAFAMHQQLIDAVPVTDTDVRMDALVTDETVLRFT